MVFRDPMKEKNNSLDKKKHEMTNNVRVILNKQWRPQLFYFPTLAKL